VQAHESPATSRIRHGRRDPPTSSLRVLESDDSAEAGSAAAVMAPVLATFFPGGVPVRFVFWDGSEVGPVDDAGVARITSPDALRRILWAPGELGLGRAFVAGDVELDGDIFALLRGLEEGVAAKAPTSPVRHGFGPREVVSAAQAAYRAGALGLPLAPPSEEARPTGWRHSKRRDAQAISHHYDVGNEFYELVIGPSMTYSCARFTTADLSLEAAQEAKFELVCRKLGLHGRAPTDDVRLLDVGCGWGSLAIHAAQRYGVRVVGVSISREQVELARERVERAGVADLVEIRLQDYRDLGGERFDAISSIGMFEHVGAKRMGEYFTTLRSLLAPEGRLLNHAISSVGGSRLRGRTFVGRYVFPDGELIDVGDVVLGMEQAGFEVRDVESLREHYAATLRAWVANLDANWDRAVELVGVGRARVWRLYMAASAVGFEDGGIAIHQTLGVVDGPTGSSGMPRTRHDFV
jgi:cyclopropane-fatty-acyl-phospholipid synthase